MSALDAEERIAKEPMERRPLTAPDRGILRATARGAERHASLRPSALDIIASLAFAHQRIRIALVLIGMARAGPL